MSTHLTWDSLSQDISRKIQQLQIDSSVAEQKLPQRPPPQPTATRSLYNSLRNSSPSAFVRSKFRHQIIGRQDPKLRHLVQTILKQQDPYPNIQAFRRSTGSRSVRKMEIANEYLRSHAVPPPIQNPTVSKTADPVIRFIRSRRSTHDKCQTVLYPTHNTRFRKLNPKLALSCLIQLFHDFSAVLPSLQRQSIFIFLFLCLTRRYCPEVTTINSLFTNLSSTDKSILWWYDVFCAIFCVGYVHLFGIDDFQYHILTPLTRQRMVQTRIPNLPMVYWLYASITNHFSEYFQHTGQYIGKKSVSSIEPVSVYTSYTALTHLCETMLSQIKFTIEDLPPQKIFTYSLLGKGGQAKVYGSAQQPNILLREPLQPDHQKRAFMFIQLYMTYFYLGDDIPSIFCLPKTIYCVVKDISHPAQPHPSQSIKNTTAHVYMYGMPHCGIDLIRMYRDPGNLPDVPYMILLGSPEISRAIDYLEERQLIIEDAFNDRNMTYNPSLRKLFLIDVVGNVSFRTDNGKDNVYQGYRKQYQNVLKKFLQSSQQKSRQTQDTSRNSFSTALKRMGFDANQIQAWNDELNAWVYSDIPLTTHQLSLLCEKIFSEMQIWARQLRGSVSTQFEPSRS